MLNEAYKVQGNVMCSNANSILLHKFKREIVCR